MRDYAGHRRLSGVPSTTSAGEARAQVSERDMHPPENPRENSMKKRIAALVLGIVLVVATPITPANATYYKLPLAQLNEVR